MGRGIERATIFPSEDDRTDFVSIVAARRRELRNEIERAIILSEGSTLRVPVGLVAGPIPDAPTTLADTERTQILAALHQTGWRIRGPNGAARLLGLKPTTLESRIKEARASASSLNGSPIRHVGVAPRSWAVPPGTCGGESTAASHQPPDSTGWRPRRTARRGEWI